MYDVKYSERLQGWVVTRDSKLWSVFAYPNEWDAIDELRQAEPEEARRLEVAVSGRWRP